MNPAGPIIFHDVFLGLKPFVKLLLERAEAGLLREEEFLAAFFSGEAKFRALAQAFHLLLGYRRYMQQVFCVGPKLQEMFSHTELRHAPPDAFKFPYPYFYVAMPDCEWELWGGPTGWHKVTGIQVGRVREDSILLYVWGAPKDGANSLEDTSVWVELDLQEARTNDFDMEEYLTQLFNNRDRDYSDQNTDPDYDVARVLEDEEIRRRTTETMTHVVRVVLNLTLYLHAQGAERSEDPESRRQRAEAARLRRELAACNPDEPGIKNKVKRKREKKEKRLKRDLKAISEAQVTWLGESIEAAAREARARGDRAPSRKHLVRGHWWPRLDNPDLIKKWGLRWKQPFERCVDAEESVPSRHYKFEEERDDDHL